MFLRFYWQINVFNIYDTKTHSVTLSRLDHCCCCHFYAQRSNKIRTQNLAITLCVIGIERGNAERQEFRITGNFRAQVNVLPVAKLFHGFANGGVGLELARSEH